MHSCAVIGCGPAGMVASTFLRQSGLLVTCFELASDCGGIWQSNSRDLFTSRSLPSPIYPSMRCVLPKDLMSFSDVRFDYTVPQFPHHTAVQHYLRQYAAQKGIRGLTRFNTKVESVRLDSTDNTWKLITVNVLNGDVLEWSFDRVCVCTGQTNEARFPVSLRETLQGYLQAGGELHHSSHVKDFRAFREKRVVVVGDGVSAYDYGAELKKAGADVHHSTLGPSPSVGAFDVAPPATPPVMGGGMAAARPDLVTYIALLCQRYAGWRSDVHRANELVHKWLRHRNERWESIPRVGPPTETDGRGITFAEDPSAMHRVAETIAEARLRRLTPGHARAPATGSGPPAGVFLDNVDAVISATGYTRRFPFLHADLRRTLEEPQLALPLPPAGNGESSQQSPTPFSPLYMGTILAAHPTMAFIGLQRELLPPFLMFEAQSRYVSYSFTHRITLPSTSEMAAREAEIFSAYPLPVDIGMRANVGLHSAVYYNALQHQLGVSSRNTYTSAVHERWRWLTLSSGLRLYHKFRAMAPLLRKQQHVLFSNEV